MIRQLWCVQCILLHIKSTNWGLDEALTFMGIHSILSPKINGWDFHLMLILSLFVRWRQTTKMNISAAADDSWKKCAISPSGQISSEFAESGQRQQFYCQKKLTTFSLTRKEGQTSHRRKIKKLKEVPKNVLFGQNLLIEALSVCGRANLALGSLLQLLLGKQKRNCA